MSNANAVLTAQAAAYIPKDEDFRLKNSGEELGRDTNFAGQAYWKEVIVRFFRKKSAAVGLILILLITLLAVVGPMISGYTYSAQNLSQKNLAPRIPVIENTGVFDGSETISTTTAR